MPDITYTLDSASFNAVPETMTVTGSLPVRSEATIARAIIHTTGVARETIFLSGKYMTPEVKSDIDDIFDTQKQTGEPVTFNDGTVSRDVIIKSFETTPIIGATAGFSFKMELAVV